MNTISQKHQNYMTVVDCKNNKKHILYTVYYIIKKIINHSRYTVWKDLKPYQVKTLLTTELHHCLWVEWLLGVKHTTQSVWNRKKVQSQKCWSNKLDDKRMCQQWWMTQPDCPLTKELTLNTKHWRNAACINLRAYQMSFKQLGWDVYGSHFYLIWVLFKNIPDKSKKKKKENEKDTKEI